MKLGPLFIAYGILWLLWAYLLWTGNAFAFGMGLVISFLSLWYLPVGTLIAIIIIIVLLSARHKLGL